MPGLPVKFDALLLFQRVSFSGGNRQIVRANLPNAYGLALFQDDIYWVDRNLRQLLSIPKERGNASSVDAVVLRAGLGMLSDVAVFDASLQPSDRESSVS